MILSVKRQEGTSCHNIAFFTIAQQVAPVNHFFDIFLIFSNNCNSRYFVTVNGANSNATATCRLFIQKIVKMLLYISLIFEYSKKDKQWQRNLLFKHVTVRVKQ